MARRRERRAVEVDVAICFVAVVVRVCRLVLSAWAMVLALPAAVLLLVPVVLLEVAAICSLVLAPAAAAASAWEAQVHRQIVLFEVASASGFGLLVVRGRAVLRC